MFILPIQIDEPNKRNSLLRTILDTDNRGSLPSFIVGNKMGIKIVLVDSDGSVTDESGSSLYRVEMAVGKIQNAPTAGTFNLSYGGDTTSAISFNASSEDIETSLNDLASITSAGGVDVFGSTGVFSINFRNAGTRTEITAENNLEPRSGISLTEAVEGDVSKKSVFLLRFGQIAAAYAGLGDWNETADDAPGWTTEFDFDTVEANLFVGNSRSAKADCEIALIEISTGNYTTLYQGSTTILRNLINDAVLGSINLPSVATQQQIEQNLYNLEGEFNFFTGQPLFQRNEFTNFQQSSGDYHFEFSQDSRAVINHIYEATITDNFPTKFLLPFRTGDSTFRSLYNGQKIEATLHTTVLGFDQPITFHTGFAPFSTGDYADSNKIFTFSGEIEGPVYGGYYQNLELVYSAGTGDESTQQWRVISYDGMKI